MRSKRQNESDYGWFRHEMVAEKYLTKALSDDTVGKCHIQSFVHSVLNSGTMYVFSAPLCPVVLSHILEAKDYSDQERQILFTQLIWAVRALHDVGIVHGDIKPSNIALQSRHPLCLVLIDTAGIQRLPATGVLPCNPGGGGTLGYLAPERDSSAYGLPVDVWAAGWVGYELLTRCYNYASEMLGVCNSQDEPCNPWRPLHTYPESGAGPTERGMQIAQRAFHHWRSGLDVGDEGNLLFKMLDPEPSSRITAHDAANHPYLLAESRRAGEASAARVQTGEKRKIRV